MRRGLLAALLVAVLASLTFAQAPDPPENFRLPPDPTDRRALTVTRSGSGGGSVAGPGIACGADCSENYIVDTTVVIHATATSGSTFTGWSGACSGTGSCSVLMNAAKSVTATFTLTSYLLTVTKGGTGTGTVTGSGTGWSINCGPSCTSQTANVVADSTVLLTATAASGSTHTGWSGACSGGPGTTCGGPMFAPLTSTANFALSPVVFHRYAIPNGLTAGTCTTTGTACRMDYALTVVQSGETLGLLDGTYNGSVANMLDLATHVPGKSGTAGARITVAAVNDGGVFIDGQFARPPFKTGGHSYWTFTGFDVGNGQDATGNEELIFINGGSNITLQRICGWNSQRFVQQSFANSVVFMTSGGNTASLFEDLCFFGIGRNMALTSYQSPGSTNVYRRIWLRHEGYDAVAACDSGPAGQLGYHDNEPYTQTYENIIMIHQFQNVQPGHHCYNSTGPSSGTPDYMQAGILGHSSKGIILYGTDPVTYGLNQAGFTGLVTRSCPVGDSLNDPGPFSYQDIFVDVRTQRIPAFHVNGSAACLPTLDRLTGLRVSGNTPTWSSLGSNASVFENTQPTNWHDCTDPAGCPDFYTGSGPGGILGARNCLEYSGGTLTSIKLWPWRMDDRIKAALARARAAGDTNGALLAGTFGSGYAANTVTSEIVSRYGAVPAACLR